MSAPGLFVIGATHHKAPLEVREKLALDASGADALRSELASFPSLREFTLLSTCNRIEFYGVASDPFAAEQIQAAFCQRQHFASVDFEKFRLFLSGRDAVLHLLDVASGLDSQIVGENEIFGQVKESFAVAQSHGSVGPVLNRVFQKAFQAAKQVRTQTAITTGQVSVANVAVDLALTIFGGLAATRILVLGTGEIGSKTAKAFKSRGAGGIVVSSRTFANAASIAAELGATAIPFEEREERLKDFDVVVSSTAAPETVIGKAAAAAAIRRRPARPLFFIDLALPRDIEASVADLQNVYLYNLDDLAKIADENRAAREAEVSRCKALILQRADALWRQVEERLGGINSTPTVRPSSGQAPQPTRPSSSVS
jgi:glutamyl-tRNA reductase